MGPGCNTTESERTRRCNMTKSMQLPNTIDRYKRFPTRTVICVFQSSGFIFQVDYYSKKRL